MFVKKILHFLQFSFSNVIFLPTLLLFLIFFRFSRVVRIYNVVCVRTSYNLVYGYKYSGGTFRIYFQGSSEDGSCMGPTRKTTVLKFSTILSVFVKRAGGGSVENVG
jgi:hypothetical protein